MTPLRLTFNRKDNTHTQVKRSIRVAIYKIQSNFVPFEGKPPKPYYEVIVIRQAKAGLYPDNTPSPAREIYPDDSQWGFKGFTLMTILEAGYKFVELKGKFG
jgi:hypothetical protein